MFDDTVTLFCRCGALDGEEFSHTVLTGVYLTELCGETATLALANGVDRAQLLLPLAACAGYTAPDAWQGLTAQQRVGHFTLRTGDIFVHGAVPDTGTPPDAYLARHDGWRISSVAEKGVGGALHHWVAGAGRLWSQTGGTL